GEPLPDIARLWHGHAQQDAPAGARQRLSPARRNPCQVSRMRSSRAAYAKTSGSVGPGAAVLIQATSCPAASGAVTAAPGKFSLARKRISGCAREYLSRAERIARIGKTRDDIVVGNTRVIPEDIGLAPSVRHQADDEFDFESRALERKQSAVRACCQF